MRELIRQQIIQSVPEVEGRVYETDVAAADEPKPYIVMMKGSETDENDWAGTSSMMEVWVYVDQTQFTDVDRLIQKVLHALDHTLLMHEVTGQSIMCRFTGSISADMKDEKFDAITRGVQFEIFSLAWMAHTVIEPDPVTAMQHWTAERFATMQTDPSSWNPSNESPALYWRMANIRNVQMIHCGAWMDATLRGHVIVPNSMTRNHWLETLVRRLALDGQVCMLDGSPMMIQRISADSSQDAFRTGQIVLDIRFGIPRQLDEATQLQHIHFHGGV